MHKLAQVMYFAKFVASFEKLNMKTCKILRNIVKSCARYEKKKLTCKNLRKLCTLQFIATFEKLKSQNLQNLAQYCKIVCKIWNKKIWLAKTSASYVLLAIYLNFEKIKSQNLQNLAQYCKILRKICEKKFTCKN